jgi:predicted nucleic acid-binding protein
MTAITIRNVPEELRDELVARAARIDLATARRAREDLQQLSFSLWPHASTSARAWALRGSVSPYDAAYVALAEVARAPLITLDGDSRGRRARGARS